MQLNTLTVKNNDIKTASRDEAAACLKGSGQYVRLLGKTVFGFDSGKKMAKNS